MAARPSPIDRVCEALRRPSSLSALTPSGWDVLVRQARCAGLLARIGCMLEAQGSIDNVPEAPRQHLRAAMLFADARHADTLRELARVQLALAASGVQPVLLKGCAYVAAGLLPAMGRIVADIDIVVPQPKLVDVEAALMQQGWASSHHSPHDERYYRHWLHELPPLRHARRDAVIHVHQSILPGTARLKPGPTGLSARARPLADLPAYAVLDAPDMVLHGMAELFHGDDHHHSLRDLSDLDLLLRQLHGPRFWAELAARAAELDLTRALYHGLRHANWRLGTPVPSDILEAAAAQAPRGLSGRLDDALWTRALRPRHPSAADRGTRAALLALYLRAHWLRLPPAKLLRHLAAKALRRRPAPAMAGAENL